MDEEKKRFWIWPAVILVALFLLAAGAWFGRSHYRHYKERHSLAEAQRFLAAGDYRNATLSAQQTLQLDPTNVPARRVMLALAERTHSPTVLDMQRRIVQAEPTIENKLQLATAGLRYQAPPFPLTSQIVEELAATATNVAAYHIVAASLALSLRRMAEAETHFETATRLEPTNRLYELNLAIVRVGETNETKAVSARAVLEKFRTDVNLGLPALRALVIDRLAHGDAANAKNYSGQILAGTRAGLPDQLQHLEILQRLKSADFDAQMKAVQRQTNASAVAEISAWMQANGLLAENLRWLTHLPASLQAQSPVRLALANNYLQGEDWRTLRDFASKGNWEEMEFLRLALVARAWSQLGVSPVAESNWGAAINEAGNRYGAMTMLLGLAERWQWQREQTDLLQRLLQKFPQERWAQHALEQIYYREGNTTALLQLYTKLFSLFPHDDGLMNNLAATSLLLKTNLPQACKLAAEVYGRQTNDMFVASTYAFALHLQGRTKEGLAVMQKLDAHVLEQPASALYYGILLNASGATNEAARFLKIAEASAPWLPEEKILLKSAGYGL